MRLVNSALFRTSQSRRAYANKRTWCFSDFNVIGFRANRSYERLREHFLTAEKKSQQNLHTSQPLIQNVQPDQSKFRGSGPVTTELEVAVETCILFEISWYMEGQKVTDGTTV